MEKYSVLTYIIGDYEIVHEIKEKSPNAEYILVTDNPNIKSDTWEVKYIYDITGTDGNTSTFDKCYFIRMFPFKFVNTNIVVRIDGDVEIKKNLDTIIEKFIEGNYDMSLMIHPDRNNFLIEYNTWNIQRGLSIEEINNVKNIFDIFGYDNEYKGMFQGCFAIHKNNKLNNDALLITYALMKYCGYSNGNIARLDQVLFSYVMNKLYSNSNIMAVSQELYTKSPYFQSYYHKSNTKASNRTTIQSYMFNKEIKPIEFNE